MSDTRVLYKPYIIGSANTSFVVPSPSGAYVGLADVLGASLGFWGLRAVSALYAAGLGLAINVTPQHGNTGTPADIHFKADGTLNETELATVIAGYSSAFAIVATFYDQSGNGLNLSASSDLASPLMVQNGLGTKSVTSFGPAIKLQSTISITQAQPFTIIGNMNRTSGSAAGRLFGFSNASPITIGFDSSAGTGLMYAGTIANFTVTDNAWNATQCMFNGGASKAYVNGNPTNSLSPGAATFNGSNLAAIGDDTFNTFFNNCSMTEIGVWAGDKSPNFAAVNNNIRTYWGF